MSKRLSINSLEYCADESGGHRRQAKMVRLRHKDGSWGDPWLDFIRSNYYSYLRYNRTLEAPWEGHCLATQHSICPVTIPSQTSSSRIIVWYSTELPWLPLDGTYFIRNKKSGTVLDTSGSSPKTGTKVQGWAYAYGNTNQRWVIGSIRKGIYTIVNVTSKTNMDIAGANPAYGTQIQGYQNNGTGNPYDGFT